MTPEQASLDVNSGASDNSAMTAWVPRLPFSFEPLIAEAKRRARRRRLLAAVLLLLLAGGAAGIVVAFSGSTAAHGSPPVAPAPTRTQLPPLSGLAARAMWCGDAYNASGRGGCHSPDNKWSIIVTNQGTGCTLKVARTGTGQHYEVRQPGRGSCAPDLWVRDTFVVQEGVYGPGGRAVGLDPPSRKVNVLARFSTFVVSPNEQWIAGEGELRPDGTPQLIAVKSLTTGTCHVVTEASSSNQDVSVYQSPWSIRPPIRTGSPYKDPVVWRTVRHGGKKIRVVSGPGTGFIRNSRSVIIAKWQPTKAAPYATNKRLVKYSLSSLRTPCPAGLAPSG